MNRKNAPTWLEIHPEIEAALGDGIPVVALESTVITHGLPRPINLDTAMRMEAEVREGGAVPATAAVLGGRVHLGLDPDNLERLARSAEARKVSLKDIGATIAGRTDGGTTVAATTFIAHSAGVRVFATGGIGGVHPGGGGDVSADLPALARWPVMVVCSGAKIFLDLPRTLEWLETAGVPVIGYQTPEFPAFYSQGSGLQVGEHAEIAQEVVDIVQAHWDVGLESGALICVPCPKEAAIPLEQLQKALAEAEAEAAAAGIGGPRLSPFLLEALGTKTAGATLQANIALLRKNARVAAEIAALL